MVYKKLFETRVSKGLTQTDMAVKLNISTSFYCQIENKNRRLSYPIAVSIAKIFGMRPDDLFYNEVKEILKTEKVQ